MSSNLLHRRNSTLDKTDNDIHKKIDWSFKMFLNWQNRKTRRMTPVDQSPEWLVMPFYQFIRLYNIHLHQFMTLISGWLDFHGVRRDCLWSLWRWYDIYTLKMKLIYCKQTARDLYIASLSFAEHYLRWHRGAIRLSGGLLLFISGMHSDFLDIYLQSTSLCISRVKQSNNLCHWVNSFHYYDEKKW